MINSNPQPEYPYTKELWIIALCAWNNVPCDNAAIKKYADQNWGKVSQEGWERVANAIAGALADEIRKTKND